MFIVYWSTCKASYAVFMVYCSMCNVYCPMCNVNVQCVLMTLYVIDHMKWSKPQGRNNLYVQSLAIDPKYYSSCILVNMLQGKWVSSKGRNYKWPLEVLLYLPWVLFERGGYPLSDKCSFPSINVPSQVLRWQVKVGLSKPRWTIAA